MGAAQSIVALYVKSSVYRTSSILHLSVVHFVNDKDDDVVPGLGL